MYKVFVASSNIQAVGYSEWEKRLVIEFKNSGSYEYTGVTPDVYIGLLESESKGKYFHANIRGKFESRKLIDGNANLRCDVSGENVPSELYKCEYCGNFNHIGINRCVFCGASIE